MMQDLATDNKRNEPVMVAKYHIAVLHAILFLILALFVAGQVSADYRTQAKRIHDRLTGVVPSEETLNQMVNYLRGTEEDLVTPVAPKYPDGTTAPNGEIAATYLAMENKHFFNATLVNFITPWTNEARAIFPEDMDAEGTLNDYTTTVIGVVRDELDFRKILWDDILYVGNDALGLTPYSYSDNTHYQELEDSGLNLGYVDPGGNTANDTLSKVSQASKTGAVLTLDDTAGIITTRAAAKAFFVAGTNRAMFRFTMLNHLCKDMEQVKDVTLPSDRIRQDVSRSPGGDSRIFMNACIGCHTGMDPLTQAFAYYNYDDVNSPNILDFTDGQVQPKNLINADNFKPGYITTDNSWVNYWREGENSLLGWNSTPMTSNTGKGTGAKSMGQELAYSNQFARCQVEKVYKAVCLHPPLNQTERDEITDNLIPSFISNGYNLKRVFAETAVYCKGP